MAVCPSCGSSRLRNGYHATPLPLRLAGIRTLLCDNCNYEFRAFAPVAPKRNRPRRAQRKADVFNLAPAVDLQSIGQPGAARPVPAAIHFDRTALPGALGSGSAVKDDFTSDISSSTDDDDFAPLDLRERMSEAPPSLPTEEPLMRLKEDLEERRSSSSSRTCPACGDYEAARRHRKMWERLVLGMTELRPYLCQNCGHQFYARRGNHRPHSSVLSQREEEFMKSSCFNQERPEQEELTSSGQEREGNDG
jgi:rubredoxin